MTFGVGVMSSSVSTTTVLGKRKTRTNGPLILHVSASESSHELSDQYLPDSEPETPKRAAKRSLILVNGSLVLDTKKKYRCTFDGCEKAYTKPCRLEEHERSHTGERPFICSTCSKSYLRETHLQAHVRSHLPESDRPFECYEPGCGKRFWTTQHLKVHESGHKGEKPWKCAEDECDESFAKHQQLRTHLCTIHAPSDTKPYQCNHMGCTKSFSTNQKLRTHSKTHDDKRYTCSHPVCISGTEITYYPTWTALQSHIRVEHPPTCPYAECKGKKFTQQRGLKAHLKIHEEREAEQHVEHMVLDEGDESENKQRRGGEYGRDWKCPMEDCDKEFKSKKALGTHYNITHLGKRDFVCPHEDCGKAYGYKHLLQRHLAKAHLTTSSSDSEEEPKINLQMDINAITGKAYAEQVNGHRRFQCPYPNLPETFAVAGPSSSRACAHFFGRAYDLRRHLRSDHRLEVEKEVVDDWVRGLKKHSM